MKYEQHPIIIPGSRTTDIPLIFHWNQSLFAITLITCYPFDVSFLYQREGDVDLYVSDRPSPTWHLENHNISAYSCGTEVITVPKA